MKKRNVWIWIIVAVVVLSAAARFAFFYFSDAWNGWDAGDWPGIMPMMGGWGMPLGMLGMAAFWVFVVFVVLRTLPGRSCRSGSDATVRLKERLAGGDITIEEYETLRKKLEEDN
ncbi:MAG: SHOCT domain-containing protein [Candidatus Izemoplasmatales bacterium]